jgi:O-antigen polymerase
MYKRVAVQRRNLTGTAWRWLTVVIAAGSVIFMITALQTQQQLTLVEQQGLQPLADDERQVLASLANPWSQSSRLDFDRHVALLLRFNHTRDLAQLAAFRRWGLRYIQTHNDPAVYASLLTIARAQQLPEAARLCEEAHGRWLRDPRFVCG